VVSRIFLVLSILWAGTARAHEVLPAIADFTVADGKLTLSIYASVEGFIAGIDLTVVKDTNASPLAQTYDALRELPPDEIAARFKAFWPEMAVRIRLKADGNPLQAELAAVRVADMPDVTLARTAQISIVAQLPVGTDKVSMGWDGAFGALVLRQQGVDEPHTGFLEAGADSGPIAIAGGGQIGGLQTFLNYIPVGFDHIVPKG